LLYGVGLLTAELKLFLHRWQNAYLYDCLSTTVFILVTAAVVDPPRLLILFVQKSQRPMNTRYRIRCSYVKFKQLLQHERGQVVAGATTSRVEGRVKGMGIAAVKVATRDGTGIMTLADVACIPGFMTDIVSLSLLMVRAS
jgi:hypothetical protein